MLTLEFALCHFIRSLIFSHHFLSSVYINTTNNTKILMGIIGSCANSFNRQAYLFLLTTHHASGQVICGVNQHLAFKAVCKKQEALCCFSLYAFDFLYSETVEQTEQPLTEFVLKDESSLQQASLKTLNQ